MNNFKKMPSTVPGISSNTITWVPTGLFNFDRMTGGGIPLGRTVFLYGGDGIGKTTLAFEITKAFQPLGHVLFLDFEEALDLQYMWACGVDKDRVRIEEPDYMEQGLQLALDCLRKNKPHYSLVVTDSVAEMTPLKELEGDVGDDHVGLTSRKLGQFLRMSGKVMKDNGTSHLVINQARDNIGGYGSGQTTTGGHAIKHKAAITLLATGGKSEKFPDGKLLKLWQKKNKVSNTVDYHCEYHIERGKGICRELEWLDIALESGLLKKKGGGNYTIGKKTFRGRIRAMEALKESPAFQKYLRGEL